MLLLAGAPVLLGLLVRLGGSPTRTRLVAVARGPPRLERPAARRPRVRDGRARQRARRRDRRPHPDEADPALGDRPAEGRRRRRADRAPARPLDDPVRASSSAGPAGRELGLTFAFAIAVLIGSFVYSTIFVALSAATSRGLVIGLGYSLLWEGLLSGALKGTQLFSVREYVRGIASALAPRGTIESVVGGNGFAVRRDRDRRRRRRLASWRLAATRSGRRRIVADGGWARPRTIESFRLVIGARHDASTMPVDLIAFTADRRIHGAIPLADDRVSDMLNSVAAGRRSGGRSSRTSSGTARRRPPISPSPSARSSRSSSPAGAGSRPAVARPRSTAPGSG